MQPCLSHHRPRWQFRREVRAQRSLAEAKEHEETVAALKVCAWVCGFCCILALSACLPQRASDDEIRAKVAEVDEWRSCGVDDYELPRSALAVLVEAQNRSLPSRFPLSLPHKQQQHKFAHTPPFDARKEKPPKPITSV